MTANDSSNVTPNDRDGMPNAAGPHLSPADARLLDLLVEVQFDVTRLGHLSLEERARAERIVAQLGLLEAYPIEGALQPEHASGLGSLADTLIDATMARVEREEDARRARMRLDPERSAPSGRRLRFPDLIAVASIALLAAVILVPLLNWRHARALDLRCDNNMRLIAEGIENYTRSYDGSLPATTATASLVPDVAGWLGYRNADNLNPLKAGHFCTSACLCCPGDHDPNGCYAYQVSVGERRPRWQASPRMAVVGDRNPLVDLKRNGETIGSVALNSASHSGRGQNLLFSDGSVSFTSNPYLQSVGDPQADGGSGMAMDNIWLPAGDRVESLLQTPSSRVDAFLLH